MPNILREILQGARAWIRQPLFFLTAIVVLAIGLGANLTIFSIIDGLLLRPLTPEHAERLVGLYSRDTQLPDSYRPFSYPNYLDVAGDRAVLESVLAHTPGMVGVAEGDVTRRVFADYVSSSYFATLGAPLARGRVFSDTREGAAVAASPNARRQDRVTAGLTIVGRDYFDTCTR